MEVELSVFPAVPIPCAVEFGRTWQPKAHPPFLIYDQVPDRGFVLRHSIMRNPACPINGLSPDWPDVAR